MSNVQAFWCRARWAALLAPALLGGCYVVPIVPVPRPYYRPHHHHHGEYRVGQIQEQAVDSPTDVAVEMTSAPL